MRLLVTGGAGFIGSNFIRRLLARSDAFARVLQIVNFDNLTYSGNLENLADVAADERYDFVRGDIADAQQVQQILKQGFDVVVNFAAETHVDRSIENAAPFLRTNVVGTQVLLEGVRRYPLKLFVHISTDEVYGSAALKESFTEEQPLDPRSPYSASKASADHLVNAHIHTYGLPATILRCTNNYGPYQFPEKLIPLMIANALEDKPVPVYGDGLQQRDWLYVQDYCRALALVVEKGSAGEVYNVSSGTPAPNLEVVKTILDLLKKPESLIRFVADRPGHDRRYALDSSKFRKAFGWKPETSFAEGIARTINWYASNREWLAHARSGAYREYYERHYMRRAETLSSLRGAGSS